MRDRTRPTKAVNVSKCTFSRVAVELISSPIITVPGTSRLRQPSLPDLDTFQQGAVQRHRLFNCFTKEKFVTLKESELSVGSYSSFLKVLHYLGFE